MLKHETGEKPKDQGPEYLESYEPGKDFVPKSRAIESHKGVKPMWYPCRMD